MPPATWSRAPPDREGWWWWCDGVFLDESLIEWWERDDDGVLRCDAPGCRETAEGILSRHPNSLWAGPIPKPLTPPR